MSQQNQGDSDITQSLKSTFSPLQKDDSQYFRDKKESQYSQAQPMYPFETSNSFSTKNMQFTTNLRSARLQQAINDLRSDLNRRRDLKARSRSMPLAIAAIATAINGCLYILVFLDIQGYLAVLSIGAKMLPMSLPGSLTAFIQDIMIMALIFLSLFGIAHLCIAYDLWRGKYSAYRNIMILEFSSILLQFIILIFLQDGIFFFIGIYVSLLIVCFATYGFFGASLSRRNTKTRQ